MAALLTILLIAEGITILNMRGLRGPHMFIGLMLIPPIALKLASTGYRFVRYYTGAPVYVAKGPPQLALRALAPLLVATTAMIFVTGVWLLLLGHHSDQVLMLHKVAFIVWSGVFGVHFLAHLPRAGRSLRAAWATSPAYRPAGSRRRSSRPRSASGSCSRSRCSRTSAPGTATTASERAPAAAQPPAESAVASVLAQEVLHLVGAFVDGVLRLAGGAVGPAFVLEALVVGEVPGGLLDAALHLVGLATHLDPSFVSCCARCVNRASPLRRSPKRRTCSTSQARATSTPVPAPASVGRSSSTGTPPTWATHHVRPRAALRGGGLGQRGLEDGRVVVLVVEVPPLVRRVCG